jgi:hypothetical protein
MGTFGQAVSVELSQRIAARVDQALARPRGYPPSALGAERAFHVYSTDALYAYYLAEDGATYEIDMDSSRGAEVIVNAAMIRTVYEHAVEQFAELAELLAITIVERVSPEVGLLEGFEAGVGLWNAATETREVAIARCATYFATRVLARDGYVVQRLPSPPNTTFLTLELVGTDPELVLELHVTANGATTIEVVHQGTRTEIAAALRSPQLPALIVALERS